MLKKVFKYDVRSMTRIWKVLGILIPILAVASAVMLRHSTMEYDSDSIFAMVILPFEMMLAALAIMAIIASFVINFIFLALRFSRNFFSDEGHLTFTTPIERKTLLLSKFLNALLWTGVNYACLIFTVLVYTVIIPIPANGALIDFSVLGDLFAAIGREITTDGLYSVFMFISGVTIVLEYSVFDIILLHFLIAKTQSGGGIGVWFGINAGVSFVALILGTFAIDGMYLYLDAMSVYASKAVSVVIVCAVMIALAVIGFMLYMKTLDKLKYDLNLT